MHHFVYSSVAVFGSEPTGMGRFDSKLAIERHLASLTMRTTIVRPSTFMELLMLPGLERCLTFFTRPDQITQFVAVEDIGRAVAAIFTGPERFADQAIEIARDALTGEDVAGKVSGAAGLKVGYRRFPDTTLAESAFLAGLAALFESGRMAAHADVASLR